MLKQIHSFQKEAGITELHYTTWCDSAADPSAKSSKPLVILLTGIAGTPDQWEPLLTSVSLPFKNKHRWVAPDLNSLTGLVEDSSHGPQVITEALESLANHIGGSELIVIGHSLGGLLAIEWMGRLPKKLNFGLTKVVLLDVPIFVAPEIIQWVADIDRQLGGVDHARVLKEFISQAFFRPNDTSSLKEKLMQEIVDYPRHNFMKLWQLANFHDYLPSLRKTQVQGLYLHSSVPTDLTLLKSEWPSLKIEHVENSGHFLHLEAPERVSEKIEKYLARS